MIYSWLHNLIKLITSIFTEIKRSMPCHEDTIFTIITVQLLRVNLGHTWHEI